MAAGRALRSEDSSVNYISSSWNMAEIYKYKARKCFALSGKRIRWLESFDLLKDFVENVIEQCGQWSTPGGKYKKFSSSSTDLTFTWNSDVEQGTLTFRGKAGEQLSETLISVCTAEESGDVHRAESAKCIDLSVLKSDYLIETGNLESERDLDGGEIHFNSALLSQSPESNLEVISVGDASKPACPFALEHTLNGIQIQLDKLQNEFEKHRSEASVILAELIDNQMIVKGPVRNNNVDEISLCRYENDILKEENKVLNERLKVLQDENAKLLKDLNNYQQRKPINQPRPLCKCEVQLSKTQNTETQTIDLTYNHAERVNNSLNPLMGQHDVSDSTSNTAFVAHATGSLRNQNNRTQAKNKRSSSPTSLPQESDQHMTSTSNERSERVIPKHLVPCPFLRRRGFCLKGWRCDFLHNNNVQQPVSFNQHGNVLPFSHNQPKNPYQTFSIEPNFPLAMRNPSHYFCPPLGLYPPPLMQIPTRPPGF